MAEPLTVDIDLLERVFPILIAHLRELEGDQVQLDHDYYWSMSGEQLHDVYNAPVDIGIGQITECVDWLSGLAEKPELALSYHLVWLGDVLRAIGMAKVR